jgi:hypothetical protein
VNDGELKVGDMASWIISWDSRREIRTGKIIYFRGLTARIRTNKGYKWAWIKELHKADSHANTLGHFGGGLCSIMECDCPGIPSLAPKAVSTPKTEE